MRNLIIIMAMALGVTSVAAQGIKRNIIESHKVNNATFEVIQKIQDEDTSYFVTIIYQNMRYSTIRDTEVIIFDNSEYFTELIDAIKEVAEKSSSEDYQYTTQNNTTVSSSKYGVFLYSKDSKYTVLNRKAFLKSYDKLKALSKYLS